MSNRMSWLRSSVHLERLWQFCAVGVVGTGFDFAVLVGLTELLEVSPVVAKLVAGEVAIVVMFALNEYWTFADWGADTWRSRLGRLVRSNLVRATGIGVATLILAILTTRYGVWYVWANAIGIGAGFFVNYSMENFLTWRTHR